MLRRVKSMNRRDFLRYSTLGGFSLAFGNFLSCAQSPPPSTDMKVSLKGIRVIDAHAHPDRYVRESSQIDTTSTLQAMKRLGMVASCFAAVGDSVFLSRDRNPGTEYGYTKTQLEWWLKGIVKSGQVRLVLKASDVPDAIGPDSPPGAIL